ncbi:MAG: hypothetical protein ACOYY2_12605 [Actinomycetota bacterium]
MGVLISFPRVVSGQRLSAFGVGGVGGADALQRGVEQCLDVLAFAAAAPVLVAAG